VEAVEVGDVEDGPEEGGDDEVEGDVPVVSVDVRVVPELLVDGSVAPHAANNGISEISATRVMTATGAVTAPRVAQRRATRSPPKLIRHPSCRVGGRLPSGRL
jgi:hypothetical protein